MDENVAEFYLDLTEKVLKQDELIQILKKALNAAQDCISVRDEIIVKQKQVIEKQQRIIELLE